MADTYDIFYLFTYFKYYVYECLHVYLCAMCVPGAQDEDLGSLGIRVIDGCE